MMDWTCQDCGRQNAADRDKCEWCLQPAPLTIAPPPPPPGQWIGWRLTLPNHVRVPLPEGVLQVGRETDGIIGVVLSLFAHVHRHHLTLAVKPDTITVQVPKGKNPVFEFPEHVDVNDPATAFAPREVRVRQLGTSDAVTLCLGQCCFIRIDRGEV